MEKAEEKAKKNGSLSANLAEDTGGSKTSFGLTKREKIAAMAMQGMLANSAVFMADDLEELTKKSVFCADALLLRLEE